MTQNALLQRARYRPETPNERIPGPPPRDPRQKDLLTESPREGGGTALAQRIVTELARKAGVDPQQEMAAAKGGDIAPAIERVMRAAHSQAGTDMEMEAIERLSRQFGVKPPWDEGPTAKGVGEEMIRR
jgi:hypothetical protein